MPDILKIFKKELSFKDQMKKAGKLIKKLFSLKAVRTILWIILSLVALFLILYFTLKPKVQKDINYGVTFSNRYAEQMGLDWKEVYIETLDDLKIKNIRLVAYWDEIEREKDIYDYSNIRWQLEEAEKRNINVILSLGRKVPRYPECFEPQWWDDLSNKNIKEQELLEYIKQTINELKNFESIKIWQVENEPFWPFGECNNPEIEKGTVLKEVELVKSLDNRPILVQDSGEGGLWRSTYKMGDYLGISMYRKIWYNFWGIFFGRFIYFQYPLAHWTYKIKANIVGVPMDKIIVTELQGEPWGPRINSELTQEEKDQTMSKNHFIATIDYAQKSGFKDLYLWGVEWWYFEKQNGNSFYWDVAKALFK